MSASTRVGEQKTNSNPVIINMKNTLKNSVKGAAIVSLALAAITSAQAQTQVSLASSYAQGDLIAGFTTGSGQDLIVNLGLESSLVNGDFWNLSSLLAGATPALSPTSGSLQFGVIGDATGPQQVFTTHTGSGLPNRVNNTSAFGTANTSIGGLGNEFLASSSSAIVTTTASGTGSWFGETLGGGTGTIAANYGNPNGVAGEGQSSGLDFYDVTVGSSGATRTLVNTFTLESNGDLLYGNISSVPEPTSYGLLAGAGLLAMSLRRQFIKKNA
jgi:hypothetical protein